MLNLKGLREACDTLFRRCDLFLPSGVELTLFTKAKDEAGAVAEILGHGVKAIVHKRGAGGASYFDSTNLLTQPGFKVDELDPTGAGRLLRRHLRELLAAQHGTGPVPRLCGGKRSAGGNTARTDGRGCQPSRS